jgi:SNF2 family DNA or RNA helicase
VITFFEAANTSKAHIIRNWKTSTAKAIASLTCVSRWAISATPVQNGLQDLLGLFKFLQFRPYNDIRTFDADITGLNKNRTLEDSMKRLNILLACVMIRRTKITASISLPPKSERVVRLRFTQQEKTHYEMIETPSAKLFNNEDAEAQASGPVWLSVLQQIHSLRLICNLGIAATPSRP